MKKNTIIKYVLGVLVLFFLLVGITQSEPNAQIQTTITETVDTPTSASVVADPELQSYYLADDYVVYIVYAFKDIGGKKAFSTNPVVTNEMTFWNNGESANISWSPVTDATGYRIFRSINLGMFDQYIDVGAVTAYEDDNGVIYTTWLSGDESTVASKTIEVNSRVGYKNEGNLWSFHSDGDIYTEGLFVNKGFTGTGNYTTFIIKGGIIINAY